MIRILVVHEKELIGSLLASMLDREEDIHVVAKATSSRKARQLVDENYYHIVLLSATLPNNGALILTQKLLEQEPDLKVLVFGLPKSKQLILQYVMAGAAGYILQEVPAGQLFENIRAAHEDKALISPTIAAAFMKQLSTLAQLTTPPNLDQAFDSLTPREHEVLQLIAKELSNQEIADQLFIQVGTVKNHVHSILKKLDVHSREDAANYLSFIDDEVTSDEP